MAGNNRKVLSESLLAKLNTMYSFTYDTNDNTVNVKLASRNRITKHDADNSFQLNLKQFGKKITFSVLDIEVWKRCQKDSKLSKYSLFDIHNTSNKLRVMYQEPNFDNITYLLQTNFNGIRKQI